MRMVRNNLHAPLHISRSAVAIPVPSHKGLVLDPDALPEKRWFWGSILSGAPPYPVSKDYNPLSRRFRDSLNITFEEWVEREAERLRQREGTVHRVDLTALKPGRHREKASALFLTTPRKRAPQRVLHQHLDILNTRPHVAEAGLLIRGYIPPPATN